MKWKKLEHNGILFPPDFETKKIKIKIKGESVDLDINQEEMIYQWAKKKDTPYAQDKVFQKNFVADFAKTFGSKYKKLELEDIDFKNAFNLVYKEKEVVIISAIRTPIGTYKGSLKNIRGDQLGSIVIKEVINRSGIDKEKKLKVRQASKYKPGVKVKRVLPNAFGVDKYYLKNLMFMH